MTMATCVDFPAHASFKDLQHRMGATSKPPVRAFSQGPTISKAASRARRTVSGSNEQLSRSIFTSRRNPLSFKSIDGIGVFPPLDFFMAKPLKTSPLYLHLQLNILDDMAHGRYFAPFLRLQVRQSICRLSGVVWPPCDHGLKWSPCISSNSKCLPQSGQMPFCRS